MILSAPDYGSAIPYVSFIMQRSERPCFFFNFFPFGKSKPIKLSIDSQQVPSNILLRIRITLFNSTYWNKNLRFS